MSEFIDGLGILFLFYGIPLVFILSLVGIVILFILLIHALFTNKYQKSKKYFWTILIDLFGLILLFFLFWHYIISSIKLN